MKKYLIASLAIAAVGSLAFSTQASAAFDSERRINLAPSGIFITDELANGNSYLPREEIKTVVRVKLADDEFGSSVGIDKTEPKFIVQEIRKYKTDDIITTGPQRMERNEDGTISVYTTAPEAEGEYQITTRVGCLGGKYCDDVSTNNQSRYVAVEQGVKRARIESVEITQVTGFDQKVIKPGSVQTLYVKSKTNLGKPVNPDVDPLSLTYIVAKTEGRRNITPVQRVENVRYNPMKRAWEARFVAPEEKGNYLIALGVECSSVARCGFVRGKKEIRFKVSDEVTRTATRTRTRRVRRSRTRRVRGMRYASRRTITRRAVQRTGVTLRR